MVVDYIRDTYQPIVDLIQSSSHVYSTAEQVVGKWIDGSEIYEKIYDLGTSVRISNTETNITSYINNYADINAVIYARAFYIGSTSSTTSDIYVGKYSTSPYVKAWCAEGGEFNYIILRYTKSTQTRSLSAPLTSQKAQIEPLEEKGEETPVEEEKAVETPETEEENEEER